MSARPSEARPGDDHRAGAAEPHAPTAAAPSRRFRAQVPTVLQMEATECGAASLAMVLAHYGRFVPLEQVRQSCGVSRDGSTAAKVARAARGYGLTTKAYRREPEELKRMRFPLIVHWRFAHFLVVEGWFPGSWYLNDPALGSRTCSDEEFDESFTGVVIEAVPGPDFEPGGSRRGVLGRLARAAGNIHAVALFLVMIGLLLLIPTILVPQLVRLYGNQLTGLPGLIAATAILGLGVAVIVQGWLLLLQGGLAVRMSSKISVRLGAAMVYRLLRLPAAYHSQRGSSALAQRAVLADQLSNEVSALTVTASTALLTGSAAALVLLVVNPPAGLIAIGVGAAAALTVRWAMRRSRDQAVRVIRELVEVGSVMASSLAQIEPIKASGAEDGVIARGLAAENRLLEANQRIGERTIALTLLPSTITGIGTVLIAAVAAFQVRAGGITPGTFLAILALAGIVIAPITAVVVSLDQAQTLRATLDQVDDVLETPEDPVFSADPDPNAPAAIRGDLRLRDVSFGYSPVAQPLIVGLDLHIAPGKRVALVGPSGCGKSTVSRLVTGLYEPWSGEVLIDERPRSSYPREVLVDRLALVDQDVMIFAGTIRDNVTLWDRSVPDADVRRAIEDAQLGAELAARPGGLDAVLEEGGADLSGGQRQRLEIARALVRNPAILVMDEATSSLDPLTEQLIDLAVRRRGITCLVIAHRLSTIRDSDEIVVLDAGCVVERGTHDELLAQGGRYSALVGAAT